MAGDTMERRMVPKGAALWQPQERWQGGALVKLYPFRFQLTDEQMERLQAALPDGMSEGLAVQRLFESTLGPDLSHRLAALQRQDEAVADLVAQSEKRLCADEWRAILRDAPCPKQVATTLKKGRLPSPVSGRSDLGRCLRFLQRQNQQGRFLFDTYFIKHHVAPPKLFCKACDEDNLAKVTIVRSNNRGGKGGADIPRIGARQIVVHPLLQISGGQ